MKRYLLLIMMSVLVSVGTWAATISGDGISGGTAGYDPKVQTLVVSQSRSVGYMGCRPYRRTTTPTIPLRVWVVLMISIP